MTANRFISKSRWNLIILYCVETNYTGWISRVMLDKHESRVWCENMNTYCYNTHRVFRADKWHDSISSWDEIESYHIVFKRTRAGCILCETIMYQEVGAETWIHCVTIHIDCSMQTNNMIAYCLEMKLYHTVSSRNKLVRDAYHAGQTSMKCLVRKHRHISLQYISSVLCRQMTWQHIVSYRTRDDIVSYRIVLKRTRAGCISCGTNTNRVFGAET